MKYIKAFLRWYDVYFCDAQGEDSPYTYDDVKNAFKAGVTFSSQKK